MRSAALDGMRPVPESRMPISVPKISSSTIRCRALRRPSRPRHRPAKNERTFTGSPFQRARRPKCRARAKSDLFLDARRLACQVAQVIKLGAAHAAAALHDDIADRGAVSLEGTLDALAVRDLAHRERGIEPAVAARDHDTFVGLHALAVALDHLHLHDHGVSRLEVRYLA